MPYIVMFTWFPPSIVKTVAQRYLETLKKLPVPSIIKRLVPVATVATKDGIESMNVDEVKKEDLGEAMEYLSKFVMEFYDIEGFRCYIKSYSTISESLKYIGMS